MGNSQASQCPHIPKICTGLPVDISPRMSEIEGDIANFDESNEISCISFSSGLKKKGFGVHFEYFELVMMEIFTNARMAIKF